ncbi:hypothetical protein VUR80DRAFT_9654 [Thermomyces stellatus]
MSSKIKDWLTGDGGEPLSGLLWIKGKPGSGKSVMIKDAYRRLTEDETRAFPPSTSSSAPHFSWTTTTEGTLGPVFLWAVLVVDDVRLLDEGRKIEYVHKHLVGLPKKLHDLYADILDPLTEEENELAMQLFYWAILTTKPLRLRGWRHIMPFIKRPVLLSLRKWRLSDELTEDDEQPIKQIRYVSRGLVEVRFRVDETADDALECTSTRAQAGSLSLGTGETRVVQVIHESVREFFPRGARTGSSLSFARTGHSPVHRPDTSSITDERRHILEDDPALLSYVTCELFSHAQLAEKCSAEMAPFTRRMTIQPEGGLNSSDSPKDEPPGPVRRRGPGKIPDYFRDSSKPNSARRAPLCSPTGTASIRAASLPTVAENATLGRLKHRHAASRRIDLGPATLSSGGPTRLARS